MSQNPNPEQYNQYSQQAPSYSQVREHRHVLVVLGGDYVTVGLLTFASASILAPLVMWFIYKDKPGYSFTKEASRRAFNFNFSLWVISMASWLLIILTFGILGIILWVVPMVVAILMVIFHSLAALAANRGEQYTYPMTFIEIIK